MAMASSFMGRGGAKARGAESAWRSRDFHPCILGSQLKRTTKNVRSSFIDSRRTVAAPRGAIERRREVTRSGAEWSAVPLRDDTAGGALEGGLLSGLGETEFGKSSAELGQMRFEVADSAVNSSAAAGFPMSGATSERSEGLIGEISPRMKEPVPRPCFRATVRAFRM